MSHLIGLSGGISSGKSLIASYFKKKRVPVVDADKISHVILKKGTPIYRRVLSAFGKEILGKDLQIDRKKLGGIVFQSPRKRQILEKIMHPAIRKEIYKKIRELKKRNRRIVVDAALLFESGLYKEMDENILVLINQRTQIERLIKRDKISKAQAQTRISSQRASSKKRRLSDYLIDNSGSRRQTENQFLTIWEGFHK